MEPTITQNGALYLAQHRARKRRAAVINALSDQVSGRARTDFTEDRRAPMHWLRQPWKDRADQRP